MPALPLVLFVVFLVLKLVGVIALSWVWVFAPLWIAAALGLVFLVFFGLFGVELWKSWKA